MNIIIVQKRLYYFNKNDKRWFIFNNLIDSKTT